MVAFVILQTGNWHAFFLARASWGRGPCFPHWFVCDFGVRFNWGDLKLWRSGPQGGRREEAELEHCFLCDFGVPFDRGDLKLLGGAVCLHLKEVQLDLKDVQLEAGFGVWGKNLIPFITVVGMQWFSWGVFKGLGLFKGSLGSFRNSSKVCQFCAQRR